MDRIQLFELWAPTVSPWSRWAKPILFAEMAATQAPAPPGTDLPRLDLGHDVQQAVVVDLPGEESVIIGLALAQVGYRPVPLYNGARQPAEVLSPIALVPVDPIVAWLWHGADYLARLPLAAPSPPAFLLDERRQSPNASPDPGRFDNRWLVFPQDFPSAAYLRSQGIQRVLLLQTDANRAPAADLAHVLLRWQEAGIALCSAGRLAAGAAQPLVVAKPSHFRSLWYRVLARAGLRRNSAGGFGSLIPQVSSGVG